VSISQVAHVTLRVFARYLSNGQREATDGGGGGGGTRFVGEAGVGFAVEVAADVEGVEGNCLKAVAF